MVILVLVSLFLTSRLSSFFWQHLPLPQLVQFPWRFLSLTTFASAVMVGRMNKKIGLLLTVLVIVLSLPWLQTTRTFHQESFYTTNDDTTTVQGEYMNRWVKVDPTSLPRDKIVFLPSGRTRINTMYFPGHEVLVDGRKYDFDYRESGFIELSPPHGYNQIQTVFKETPLRLVADAITVVSLAFSIFLMLKYRL